MTEFEKLPYWDHLTGAERELVGQSVRRLSFPRGAMVHGAEGCLGLVLVQRGRLRAHLPGGGGGELCAVRLLRDYPDYL